MHSNVSSYPKICFLPPKIPISPPLLTPTTTEASYVLLMN